MTAYMIFIRETPIRDKAEMKIYQTSNRDNMGAFTIKPLVVYGALEAIEGAAPDGVVILEFPSVAEAKAWYNSPAYQAAIPHRLRAADYRVMIVEGFTPPKGA